ncbi:MAG: periplasmic heavy metal sensor [Pseudomonadota bacterium]
MSDERSPGAPVPPEAGPPPPEPRRGRRRWIGWALFASVGLNLLVAGALVGAALDARRAGPSGPPGAAVSPMGADGAGGRGIPDRVVRELGLGPYARAMTPGERRHLGRALLSEIRTKGGPRAVRRQMRESFAAVRAALLAEPFDADELDRLITAQSARAAELRELAQAIFVVQVSEMTPDERRAFADRLDGALRRARGADSAARVAPSPGQAPADAPKATGSPDPAPDTPSAPE